MSKPVILFLAANPGDTARLALAEECAAIEHELKLTPGRDDLAFHAKWAVSVDELMRHLNDLDPTVIHFTGHGRSEGILLHGQDGLAQPVSAAALRRMVETAAPRARVVVLNACETAAQAEALAATVDCVVGMAGAIDDGAARTFAVGFYRALGHRRSIGAAVAQACAALDAKQFLDERLPRCRTRAGLDADQIFLTDIPLSASPSTTSTTAPTGSTTAPAASTTAPTASTTAPTASTIAARDAHTSGPSRRWLAIVAVGVMAAIVVAAAVLRPGPASTPLFAIAPAPEIARLPSGGAIVVMPSHSGAEVEQAFTELCREVPPAGSQQTRCVRVRWHDVGPALIARAREANAGLLVVVGPGPVVRLVPLAIRDPLGPDLAALPWIPIERSAARTAAAALIVALGRIAAGNREIAAEDVPAVAAREVDRNLAALIFYLRSLAGLTRTDAAELDHLIGTCRSESSAREWACALAYYLRGDVNPRLLEEVARDRGGRLQWLAHLSLARTACREAAPIAATWLARAAAAPAADDRCLRFALAPVARCIETRVASTADAAVRALAAAELPEAGCWPPAIAGQLDERGYWSALVGDWTAAEGDYRRANDLAPGPVSALNWAEAALRAPLTAGDRERIRVRLDPALFTGAHAGMAPIAAFLRWLATNTREDALALVAAVARVPVGQPPLAHDRHGTLRTLVCEPPAPGPPRPCAVYDLLAEPWRPDRSGELRELVMP